ncbi:CBO0543 family protein [Mesobacillus jeotgali]|uniref:CBO0543 family protein n=1 Tax=Mesobacillus jeotgali TaxID=129985 RepID=UPI0009A72D04|nr:CBO0543 family protein [Mesobacillus jeotgali]
MKRTTEQNILRMLIAIGIFAFYRLVRKPPVKDWLLIFFLKSYLASILDTLLVKKGYLKYPVSLFKTFDISVIFSYLIFPVCCVYFNQVTRNSGIISILLKSLLFSAPSAMAESWLERNTKLIKYKKNWTSIYSFSSIASTFLAVRFVMGGIRKLSNKVEN